MSLILEALRKSEAERRRGQAPGLFVEQVPVAVRRPSRRPAWIWVLPVLLVGVVAAWAWREWPRDSAQASAPMSGAVDEITAAPPATTTPPLIGTVSGSPPAPTAAPAPAPVAKAPTIPDEPMRATPSPRAPAMPLDKTLEPAAEESLPRLAELPASDRGQLPPLKLSMHVYADEPAQRFVILDGQRLHEGASPAAGVVLEQIRRDGLVLSVNGRRVLLARP